ncbi:hypothetical protein EAI_13717, partial [Harpegnathos saltator]
KDIIKIHSYKISTYKLLTIKAMEKKIEFCKTIIDIFENEKF